MDGWNGNAAVNRASGAMRLPVMVALWALCFLVVQELRGEAVSATSAERLALAASAALTPPPSLDSRDFLDGVTARSDVLRGDWQPSRQTTRASQTPNDRAMAQPKVAIEPKAHDAPAAPAIRTRATLSAPDRKLAARVAISVGDDQGAYRLLVGDLPDVRDDRERFDLLAAVAMRIGRYAEAADVYRALVALDGANPRLWAGYALAQEQLGEREAVAFSYRKLLLTAAAGSPLHQLALERLSRFG